jgi:ribosomal protein S8
MLRMNNSQELRLIDIILENHNTLIVDIDDKNRTFLDQMCHEGFVSNFGDASSDKKYYHVNKKLKTRIMEILRSK